MPIRIAITDDHPLAINGIKMMLGDEPELKVTATYATAKELLKGLKTNQPDVLLLDIKLPDQPGNEVAAHIIKHYPELRIVVLTSLDAPAVVKNMMQLGCIGYLLKGADKATLVQAIRKANDWEEFIEPSLKKHILQNTLNKHITQLSLELTKREIEVLKLIVTGDTTAEIAEKLFISPRTAETHRLTLLKKLDVKNTAGLVRMAFTLGIVTV